MEPLSETTIVSLWAGLTVVVSIVASSHVVINKRKRLGILSMDLGQ